MELFRNYTIKLESGRSEGSGINFSCWRFPRIIVHSLFIAQPANSILYLRQAVCEIPPRTKEQAHHDHQQKDGITRLGGPASGR